MTTVATAPDRVGRALLWGLGFSLAFHVVLFSPQLAMLLDPEHRDEFVAQVRETARKAAALVRPDKPQDPNAPRPPDAPKPPEAQQQPPSGAQPKPPEDPAKQGSKTPPPPPLPTPTPSPAYPDVEDVAIGQDNGDPMSVVIIGHDAYEQHMAQLSEVEQAGYRMSDAGGDGSKAAGRGDGGDAVGGGGSAPKDAATTAAANTPGTPQVPEQTRVASEAPAERSDAAPTPEAPAKPADAGQQALAKAEPKPEEPAPPAPPVQVPAPHVEPEPEGEPTDSQPPPPDAAPMQKPKPPVPPEAPKPAEVPPAPEPPAEAKPTAPTDRQEPTPPPANQPPASQPGGGIASGEKPVDGPKDKAAGEAGKAGGSGPSPTPGSGGKGELSDMESAATSLVQVDPRLWKNGRLITGQGVQVKPKRKPEFTMLQIVSRLPACGPPVVSMTFNARGRCIDVFFNRSSGDPEIDDVLRNAMLFWTAEGKKVEALKGDEKVRVTLQILF